MLFSGEGKHSINFAQEKITVQYMIIYEKILEQKMHLEGGLDIFLDKINIYGSVEYSACSGRC